ncbi:unnamed protein product [Spirodela intermedia]|uniref:TOD1/MUCI70 glycosyltransferase-like domain-containing protein n=1 Tax=Spirodela intermedia TaxID=51605 RepID=A0A7I8JSL4_SPIIN|nr:unnamed protein product [Spirodela intermedia]CAA6673180.1 unnamed protein product [Spirodela intermedia]
MEDAVGFPVEAALPIPAVPCHLPPHLPRCHHLPHRLPLPLPSPLYTDLHSRLGEPLFSYPTAYGEHKHALPSSSSSPSCDSPVLFQEPSYPSPAVRVRYMSGTRTSFAGNFTTQERKSYFTLGNSGGGDDDGTAPPEVPCGFFGNSPFVCQVDKAAMESCKGGGGASAIFSDHDKLRQPMAWGSRPWRPSASSSSSTTPPSAPSPPTISSALWNQLRRNMKPQTESPTRSASPPPSSLSQRQVQPLGGRQDAANSGPPPPDSLPPRRRRRDMAVSRHPLSVHTMEEAVATARWRKWPDVDGLRAQMEAYCENGFSHGRRPSSPTPTDVPDTAIILRRHGRRSDLFSCLLFNELEDLMRPQVRIHMFPAAVLEQIAVEYRHNLKPAGGGATAAVEHGGLKPRRPSSRGLRGSSCKGYLLKMWGEEANDGE